MNNSRCFISNAAVRVLRVAGLAALVGLAVSTTSAQAPNDPNAGGRGRRGGQGGQDAGNGGRGNFSPEEAQTRMLAGLRERFGITNDEEWGLISTRITAVMEIRRTIGGGGGGPGGFGGGRGGPPPGGGDAGGRGGRGGRGGPGGGAPEVMALQVAITDNLPEAEIKSRLDRVRDLRKNAEAKVQKVQEELRAVLTVKQEATAVLAGLLP